MTKNLVITFLIVVIFASCNDETQELQLASETGSAINNISLECNFQSCRVAPGQSSIGELTFSDKIIFGGMNTDSDFQYTVFQAIDRKVCDYDPDDFPENENYRLDILTSTGNFVETVLPSVAVGSFYEKGSSLGIFQWLAPNDLPAGQYAMAYKSPSGRHMVNSAATFQYYPSGISFPEEGAEIGTYDITEIEWFPEALGNATNVSLSVLIDGVTQLFQPSTENDGSFYYRTPNGYSGPLEIIIRSQQIFLYYSATANCTSPANRIEGAITQPAEGSEIGIIGLLPPTWIGWDTSAFNSTDVTIEVFKINSDGSATPYTLIQKAINDGSQDVYVGFGDWTVRISSDDGKYDTQNFRLSSGIILPAL
ncbi:MAG: hypothetical protein AAGA66_02880 [Bacteroidota bacterium]